MRAKARLELRVTASKAAGWNRPKRDESDSPPQHDVTVGMPPVGRDRKADFLGAVVGDARRDQGRGRPSQWVQRILIKGVVAAPPNRVGVCLSLDPSGRAFAHDVRDQSTKAAQAYDEVLTVRPPPPPPRPAAPPATPSPASIGPRFTGRDTSGNTRLTHVFGHTQDNRLRWNHGVFHGQGPSTVSAVNEAWRRRFDPGVRVTRSGARTAYDIPTGRSVGRLGGQAGRTQGPTPLSTMRRVAEGDRMITAFPVRP